jgi:hypothetical protein
MQRKIKLIWDFKGESGLKTAEHHATHLKEFAAREKLSYDLCDFNQYSEIHAIAFIIVDEVDMKTYRDALKPHRGALAK